MRVQALCGGQPIELINNSHKLIRRCCHTIIIIFLMARSDNGSYCDELNWNVLTHILKFIY